jgi:predicted amidophosphoribosyltransferase
MIYPLPELVRDVTARFLDPLRCVVCGEDSRCSRPLCPRCERELVERYAKELSFINSTSDRCSRCGRPLISARGLCMTCRTTPVLSAIDRVLPLFPYDIFGQELLTSWKIDGLRGFSWTFARFLADVIARSGLAGVPVVPVPPRPGKIREKGWDQIEELSRILERRFDIPVNRCLERTGGLQQKKLGRLARTSNLRGYIGIRKGSAVPSSAIVLDDLMTTGSTLDACAGTLKNAGCGKVYGLTLFFD